MNRIPLVLLLVLLTLPSFLSAQRGSRLRPTLGHLSSEAEQHIHNRINNLPKRQLVQRGNQLWGLYLAETGLESEVRCETPPQDPPGKEPCNDCGDIQPIPSDPCLGLRNQLRDLNEQLIYWGLIANALRDLQTMQANAEFYGGVAGLVADVVGTTVSLATAGGGKMLARAAANQLKDIAMDQIQQQVMDMVTSMLPPPLDAMAQGELDDAAIDQLIGIIEGNIVDLSQKKQELIPKLNDCIANYNATKKQIEADNQIVANCQKANPAYCVE